MNYEFTFDVKSCPLEDQKELLPKKLFFGQTLCVERFVGPEISLLSCPAH